MGDAKLTLRTSSGEAADTGKAVEASDAGVNTPASETGQTAASVTDANPKSETPAPEAAKPSAADETKDAKKPTLADVIKTAAKIEEGKPSTPAKTDTKVEVPKVDGEKLADEQRPKPEDDKNLPFHNHPRWKEVVGERDALKDRVTKLEPDAEQYGKITSFMTEHQLSADEVGDGFVVMAMIKAGDPRALERLDTLRAKVAAAVGEVIPDDLKAKVDAGALTEDAAKEVSRARAATARATADTTRAREAANRTTQQANETALVNDLMAATDEWAAKTASKDPDFAKKSQAITRFAQALMHTHGRPKNKADVAKLMEGAYAEVNKTFVSVMSAKEPIKPVTNANSSTSVKAVPKTLAEAVRLAAAG